MKKLLFVFSFLASLLLVQPASATLSSYYKEQGKSLPTCAERKVIALREYQMKNYSCSVKDNNLLESKLRGQSGLSPVVTYWVNRIKNNATKPLTKEELKAVPDEAWNEVTPQLIQFVTQGGEDNVGGAEVTHSLICRGHECDKYLKGNEVVGFSVATSYRTTLSSSMSSSQTTVPVSSLLTKDGTTLTMALLGSKVFLTVEPGSSREEISKCTSIASSQFAGCTRGLAFSGTSEASVTANAKAHNAGSIVIMSNVHYVYDQLADKDSTEDVGGIKRFTSSTIKVGDGTTASNKIIYGDNGTASLPFLRYNEGTGRWQFSDNGSDTVNFTTSSAAGLAASSTKGIGITDSLIHINASSTGGLEFSSNGTIQVKAGTNINVNSGGVNFSGGSANNTWTGNNTFTGGVNVSSTNSTPNFLIDGFTATSSTVSSTIPKLKVDYIGKNTNASTTVINDLQVNGSLSYSGTKYGGTSSCANESTYTNTGTLTVTCGFQPSFINVFSVVEYNTGGGSNQATRSSFGFYDCTTQHYIGQDSSAAVAGTSAVGKINTIQGGSTTWDMTASCSATGFTVTATKTGSPGTIAVMGVGVR